MHDQSKITWEGAQKLCNVHCPLTAGKSAKECVFVFISLFYICICSVFVFVSLIVFIFVFALTAENEVRHPAVHWSAKVRAVPVVPPEVPHLNHLK